MMRFLCTFSSSSAAPKFNIVLFQPRIPNNTGVIGRTCSLSGCRLHLIHPLGFSLDEKARRRAGLDYWDQLDVHEHEDWCAYLRAAQPKRVWLYTTAAERLHWDAQLEEGDHLLFGNETHGTPEWIKVWLKKRYHDDHTVRLPMQPRPDGETRSYNLANAVSCAVMEGLRQIDAATPPAA